MSNLTSTSVNNISDKFVLFFLPEDLLVSAN